MGYLTAHRSQKVLVICAKAATALQLEQVLREREGIRAAVFHEGMSIVERDRAAAGSVKKTAAHRFCCALKSVLKGVTSSSPATVMFDLPFNPDLLEQRIGRLDRIGQAHDIQIHVLTEKPLSRCWYAGSTKVWTRSNIPVRRDAPFTIRCIRI